MLLPTLFWLALAAQGATPKLTHGPLRGASDATSMDFWARASEPGEYQLWIDGRKDAFDDETALVLPVTSTASAENDFTLHWRFDGLKPDTAYRFARLLCVGDQRASIPLDTALELRTAVADEAAKASLVFGSCCEEKLRPDQPIWKAIDAVRADAIVLLGDTPYVDSTDLEVQRKAYREFLDFAPIRRSLSATACWFTWDDHDYAWNDQFGRVLGRENSRRAFLEYHATRDVGAGGEGIFTSFRRGPVEVFLLDTRWFADVEKSPLAQGERSLLGGQQIAWLQAGLLASKAPFKLLACGMVWNGAVRPGKKDCWGNWSPERDALLKWIGEKKIKGLVLVGGDIHRSRVILHPVASLVGYDVPELISSPLAQSVIETNKVDLPGLLFDVGSPASFLHVRVERGAAGAKLTGDIADETGTVVYSKTFSLAELTPKAK